MYPRRSGGWRRRWTGQERAVPHRFTFHASQINLLQSRNFFQLLDRAGEGGGAVAEDADAVGDLQDFADFPLHTQHSDAAVAADLVDSAKGFGRRQAQRRFVQQQQRR